MSTLVKTLVLFFTSAAAAAVIVASTAGAAAARGLVVGAVMVAVVFTLGMVLVHAVSAVVPALSLLVALLTYGLQLMLLATALFALERSGLLESGLERRWVGGAIVVGTLVWSGALVRVALRADRSREPAQQGAEHG